MTVEAYSPTLPQFLNPRTDGLVGYNNDREEIQQTTFVATSRADLRWSCRLRYYSSFSCCYDKNTLQNQLKEESFWLTVLGYGASRWGRHGGRR